MERKRWFVTLLTVLLFGALLLPLRASATTWSAPFALGGSPGGKTVGGSAIDSSGNIHYVWWSNNTTIEYAKCNLSNVCGGVQEIPTNGQPSYYPAIAIDLQGNPNIVWQSADNTL